MIKKERIAAKADFSTLFGLSKLPSNSAVNFFQSSSKESMENKKKTDAPKDTIKEDSEWTSQVEPLRIGFDPLFEEEDEFNEDDDRRYKKN